MKQAYYLAAVSFTLAAPMGAYAQFGTHTHKAHTTAPTTAPTTATNVATPSSSSTAAPAASPGTKNKSTTGDTSTGSGWCIDLSGNIDFYYTIQGWGSSSGKGPLTNFCPGYQSGAIFIGTEANPESGNTKLECAFVATAGGISDCDVSLVDGYSVSVTCTAPGSVKFGSSVDLWSQNTCPDVVGSTCVNVNGGSATSISQIAEFFQPASPDDCIWHDGINGDNDPSLTQTGTIDCTVSGGKPSSKKSKREDDESAGVVLKDVMEHVMEPRGLEDLGIAKRHGHRARAHSRGLRELVGAVKG